MEWGVSRREGEREREEQIKGKRDGAQMRMGLYHPLDGVTNLKYKLLYFLTPNKKNFKEKGTIF